MTTHPYLHFQGRCREAMTFYAEVLGGTDLQMIPYSEAPGTPEAWKGSDRVMHAQMRIGMGHLMGSDFPPGFEGDPQKAVSVMQVIPGVDVARRVYDRLLEGGDVIQPFGPTFWSEGFGMVRDRFGTHWIIGTAPEAA